MSQFEQRELHLVHCSCWVAFPQHCPWAIHQLCTDSYKHVSVEPAHTQGGAGLFFFLFYHVQCWTSHIWTIWETADYLLKPAFKTCFPFPYSNEVKHCWNQLLYLAQRVLTEIKGFFFASSGLVYVHCLIYSSQNSFLIIKKMFRRAPHQPNDWKTCHSQSAYLELCRYGNTQGNKYTHKGLKEDPKGFQVSIFTFVPQFYLLLAYS